MFQVEAAEGRADFSFTWAKQKRTLELEWSGQGKDPSARVGRGLWAGGRGS